MRTLIVLGFLASAGIVSAQQPAPTPAKPAEQAPAAAAPAAPAPGAPATQKEKLSYAVGMNLARQFKNQSIEIDPAMVAQGMRDVLAGGKTALTAEEERAVVAAFEEEMRGKQETMRAQAAEKNMKEGEAFLASNKTKEGVVTTPSGLQYKVLTAGTGPKPALDDTVVCHYRGTLIDGTEFDSSYKRNEPAKFQVNRVIKGWTEALQLMPVGSKWQLWIPSNLAYGERGVGPQIGPNTMLTFEVELISIQPKP